MRDGEDTSTFHSFWPCRLTLFLLGIETVVMQMHRFLTFFFCIFLSSFFFWLCRLTLFLVGIETDVIAASSRSTISRGSDHSSTISQHQLQLGMIPCQPLRRISRPQPPPPAQHLRRSSGRSCMASSLRCSAGP